MGEFGLSKTGKTRYTTDSGITFEIEEAGSRLRATATNADIEVGWGDKRLKRFARYLDSIGDEEHPLDLEDVQNPSEVVEEPDSPEIQPE
jgi:hypothetical protein